MVTQFQYTLGVSSSEYKFGHLYELAPVAFVFIIISITMRSGT